MLKNVFSFWSKNHELNVMILGSEGGDVIFEHMELAILIHLISHSIHTEDVSSAIFFSAFYYSGSGPVM